MANFCPGGMPPEQNSPTLKWRSTGEFYFGTFGEYSLGTDIDETETPAHGAGNRRSPRKAPGRRKVGKEGLPNLRPEDGGDGR